MDKQITDAIELAEAWGKAVDNKINLKAQLVEWGNEIGNNGGRRVKLRDPVKRRKILNFYKKAERVCDRLAKQLCQTNISKP